LALSEAGELHRKLKFVSDPIPVERTADMTAAMCYSNARDFAAEMGGTVVTGYMMIIWPSMFLEALHHAVVRARDGTLIDVTAPAYPGLEKHDECLFAADTRILGDADPGIRSEFIVLSANPAVRQWTKVARDRMDAYRALIQLPHTSRRVPSGPLQFAFEHSPEFVKREARYRALEEQKQDLWHRFAV